MFANLYGSRIERSRKNDFALNWQMFMLNYDNKGNLIYFIYHL